MVRNVDLGSGGSKRGPFVGKETLFHIVSLSTQVYKMGTSDILLGVTLQWTSISSRGEY